MPWRTRLIAIPRTATVFVKNKCDLLSKLLIHIKEIKFWARIYDYYTVFSFSGIGGNLSRTGRRCSPMTRSRNRIITRCNHEQLHQGSPLAKINPEAVETWEQKGEARRKTGAEGRSSRSRASMAVTRSRCPSLRLPEQIESTSWKFTIKSSSTRSVGSHNIARPCETYDTHAREEISEFWRSVLTTTAAGMVYQKLVQTSQLLIPAGPNVGAPASDHRSLGTASIKLVRP